MTGVSSGGITVQGRAVVRRPADFLRFQVSLAPRQQNPLAVVPAGDALVALMKKNGVDDAAIVLPLSGFIAQQQIASIVGTIQKPSIERVRAFVVAMGRDTPADIAPIQGVAFTLGLNDCDAIETVAQGAAIKDARAHAEKLAVAANVHVGNVISISEQQGPVSTACPTKPDRVAQFNGNGAPFDNGGNPFDVVISTFVTVTFAIR